MAPKPVPGTAVDGRTRSWYWKAEDMMPKKDDAPDLVACHGCALVTEVDDAGYCDACAAIRADDPPVTVQGRTLLLSEMEAQAEAGDVDLKAALDGDTVQDQVKAARKR